MKWIIERVKGRKSAIESPLGWMPAYSDIDWQGLDFSQEYYQAVQSIDIEVWKREIMSHEELFEKIQDRLPKEFYYMRELLLFSIWRAPRVWRLADEVVE